MIHKMYSRGHSVVSNDGKTWEYEDTGENYDDSRNCVKCGLSPSEDGHDPCIANLPGVKYACCGHGVEPGYVSFEDGRVIRGEFDHIERRTNEC